MIGPVGYIAADVGWRDAHEVVELLVAAGYGAVDWTMEQFEPLDDDPADLQHIAEHARAAGLATPQLMVHQDYVTNDAAEWERRVARSERAVDAAALAGIPSIGVVTGPNQWVEGHTVVGRELSCGQAWDLALRALERVVGHAEGSGVRVCLEPCWGTLAYDRSSAQRVLDRFGVADLGVTIDPSHFVMSGDDVPAMVRDWADRVSHVHLKDAFGRAGRVDEDFCFLLPGEGRVDWPGLLAALTDIGYDGAACVEFESFVLLEGPLRGDLARAATLTRELVGGLLAAAVPERS
jgi:sugar phosphate isomerase/epimerase